VPEGEKADALDLVMGSLISMLAIEYVGLRSTSAMKWLQNLSDPSGSFSGEYPQIAALTDKLTFAIKARNTLVRLKPTPVKAQHFADHLIAGLKAQFSMK
jgi:hypothetical protein